MATPARPKSHRSTTARIAALAALLALTAALQAAPAGAMVSDEGIGVCERVPGVGGWNFTTGQPCTLDESAGGGEDPGDGPIEVVATLDPNAMVGERIYVSEQKRERPCPDFGCMRRGRGRSAADPFLLGDLDAREGRGSGRKAKAEDKKEKKLTRDRCFRLGLDGLVWNSVEGRADEAGRIKDRMHELNRRLLAFDLAPIGNEATQKMLSAMRDAARSPLQAERDNLRKELAEIERSRARYEAEGCEAIMREPRAAEPGKGSRSH